MPFENDVEAEGTKPQNVIYMTDNTFENDVKAEDTRLTLPMFHHSIRLRMM